MGVLVCGEGCRSMRSGEHALKRICQTVPDGRSHVDHKGSLIRKNRKPHSMRKSMEGFEVKHSFKKAKTRKSIRWKESS